VTQTRRQVLAGVLGAGVTALAGCASSVESELRTDADTTGRTATENTTTADGPPVPTVDTARHLGHSTATLRDHVVSGGVPKDGIPSIDDPSFSAASDVTLAAGTPVFGVARNGEAKAYPQYILVHHEIVNDVVGGEPVAVTYCPLTGTAEGFRRGESEFGVSGDLVNANLVMYDRGTDTRWPQILATGIAGPLEGETLDEFRVVWTTWEEWRTAHPETRVLTEDTGYIRRYGTDPYGDYNPRTGYYKNRQYYFSPIAENDRAHPKNVVLGARTSEEAVAFDKDALLRERVRSAETPHANYVAVADPELSTGYVYRNPDGVEVSPADDAYEVNGETQPADSLPLPRVLTFDAMWFAWAGFYPETTYVE
jgi:hypothetical protein